MVYLLLAFFVFSALHCVTLAWRHQHGHHQHSSHNGYQNQYQPHGNSGGNKPYKLPPPPVGATEAQCAYPCYPFYNNQPVPLQNQCSRNHYCADWGNNQYRCCSGSPPGPATQPPPEANPCSNGEPAKGVQNNNRFCDDRYNKCPDSFWCHYGFDRETTVCCPNEGLDSDVCKQPIEKGRQMSEKSGTRYAFNRGKKKCERFTYLGSMGNQNNFLTLAECDLTCVPTIVPFEPADAEMSGQCPCIKSKGSTSCVAYNPRYQASSLQEALSHFYDPTGDGEKPFAMFALDQSPKEFCKKAPNVRECKVCAKYLIEHVKQEIGSMADSSERNGTLNEIDMLYDEYQLDHVKVSRNEKCNSFSLGIIAPTNTMPRNPSSAELQEIQAALQGKKSYSTQIGDSMWKRQAGVGNEISYIGKFRCTSRGDLIGDGSNYVGLCDICWSYAALRSDFFPSYVNTITCSSNTNCLSGWGQCRERKRSFNVLRRSYSPQGQVTYEPYTINLPLTCECQVRADSALINFVRGNYNAYPPG